ncbi:MAG: ATP-binding cassette domain-containing protein [Acidimicrobiia bacterium]|nr:MAG: ATP-binding cassette domain-containing protein [Acidimicrobiia bacterium]
MKPLIQATGLTKKFGDLVAVDGIDFSVAQGESFGFLGPNGAGKTSTMKMIGATSPVSGGELSVLGLDPTKDGPTLRSRLGVVPQENNLDEELSVYDNLMMYGRYFDMSRSEIRERIEELLEFVQLTEKKDEKIQALSGGMKRRAVIARGLVHDPDLFILDEPTTGLDPQARHVVWDRLYRLKQQGVTLIITTHYMDEAEQLCDRLVVMDNGKIVAEGSPRSLIEEYAPGEVVELRFPIGVLETVANQIEDLAPRTEVLADRALIYTEDAEQTIHAVTANDLEPETVLARRSTLEDVFLRLTGRSLAE